MIGRLGRFFRLGAADRARLAKAALVISAIRLALRLLPFRVVRRLLVRSTITANDLAKPDRAAVAQIAWAVAAAGRHMPWAATCLTRAMAAQMLLGRIGEPTHLHLGVAKDEQGRLKAHAWLESDGTIVIGDDGDISSFARMPPLEIGTP